MKSAIIPILKNRQSDTNVTKQLSLYVIELFIMNLIELQTIRY